MGDSNGIFGLLAKRMDWLGQRQSVIADNIANADTPEFTPSDLKAGPFRRMLLRQGSASVRPAATHSGHIRTSTAGNGDAKVGESRNRYETSPSGNSVVLEEQLIKMSQTQADHQTMANLYRKHVTMLKLALRNPS